MHTYDKCDIIAKLRKHSKKRNDDGYPTVAAGVYTQKCMRETIHVMKNTIKT